MSTLSLKQVMKRNNAWNIRRLVGGSLGQTNQQTSVLYVRLTEFKLNIISKVIWSKAFWILVCFILLSFSFIFRDVGNY